MCFCSTFVGEREGERKGKRSREREEERERCESRASDVERSFVGEGTREREGGTAFCGGRGERRLGRRRGSKV